ncbi:unnamed protein product [Rotaria sp. Silwood2]|nr:unnamed protein product [Rotaria sp. Silwood2]CAF2728317.1 unnamed protein product [Rotaria sp. Silwood2]CAF2750299.1 unnamed protein product [Rotaria sp. Silwood2]CAF3139106.1 unnamed protein product [Rotaria sp. Silwood2]CAF3857542.1 unnamed protein product [Rotaria sp. Silwood2]
MPFSDPSPVVVVMAKKSIIAQEDIEEPDIRREHEMGYEQELYRGFSPFMSFAFCFTAVNVLTSISISFTYALNTGGSAMVVWSWLIGSSFTILVGLSLAEICSVYPSAGSVYYWAGQLVPSQHAPLASFICGWFNFIGNAAANAAFSSGFATIVNAALVLNGKESLSIGAQVGISIGITFVWAIQNIFRIDQQGWLNNIAAIFQITSTITTIAVLLVMAPERASAHDVFISTYNGTGFPFSYLCFISILSTLYSLSGYDAGAHLAEETQHAGRAGNFAMARDGVFPFSSSLRWIFPLTKAPLAIVAFVVIIDCLLVLLQLVSTTAFAAIISVTTLGFQISYSMPIFFRCTVARKSFTVGEVNLGRFGLPIAIVSVVWLLITSILMFFPANYPVTSDNMNYAIVIVGGLALIATTYWVASARHWFRGPKRNHINSSSWPSISVAKVDSKKAMSSYNVILTQL